MRKVPFSQAIRAFIEGHTIKCNRGNGEEFIYDPQYAGLMLYMDEIINGVWYVLEEDDLDGEN